MSRVFVVAGLGFGDEGKGATVDWLVRRHGGALVVRYNGGPQAAHFVVAPDGATHCFSQLGSGMFVTGAETLLSRFMLVDPLALELEAAAIAERGVRDALARLWIERECLIVTPFHKILNRMLERSRGEARHGSCGRGVGQALADAGDAPAAALLAGDLSDRATLRRKLRALWHAKLEDAARLAARHAGAAGLDELLAGLQRPDYVEALADAYERFAAGPVHLVDRRWFAGALARWHTVVFEGAQGALLDAHHGFLPHVTATSTTLDAAFELLRDAGGSGAHEIHALGVLRAYATRHGAGPFVTEDDELAARMPACDNGANEWQGRFRVGWFDLVATRYALDIAGPIGALAITNVDRLAGLRTAKICTAYACGGAPESDLCECPTPGRISRLVARPQPAGERQMRLTALLRSCTPIYDEVALDPAAYIARIERELNRPVALVATGPGAQQRSWIIRRQ
ncbi:MAG: adenylosuccinate synthetase [Candidatus Schekmanbacteria bacterium]|nr:adenylosuccinate synthetase [Candidatus Schekmanbacteria bacterium]